MTFGLLEALFLLALVAHNRRTLGCVHGATMWGGGLLFVTAVSRTPVIGTDVWLAFARALLG
jgi:hypothetical protein